MRVVCFSRGLFSYKSPLFFQSKVWIEKIHPQRRLTIRFSLVATSAQRLCLWKPRAFCKKLDQKLLFFALQPSLRRRRTVSSFKLAILAFLLTTTESSSPAVIPAPGSCPAPLRSVPAFYSENIAAESASCHAPPAVPASV